MDDSYPAFIAGIKNEIARQRTRAALSANADMVALYWRVGHAVLAAQKERGWDAKVIDRISADIHEAFPNMTGFSARNIKYMRKFAECWPDFELVQRAVALIPWRSNITLMDKLHDSKSRLWYAQKTLENGWSKDVLQLQIESHLMERAGGSVNNFASSLPSEDSDRAEHIFKDPYLFGFLDAEEPRKERDVERQLVDHIQEFLLELGQGFAFVGKQVHLEVGGDDFYLDLLFYHLVLRRYVIIELKARELEPGFLGQLAMYRAVVDDLLRHGDDKPSIGLLLVKGKSETVVRYSLADQGGPVGVADWTSTLQEALPDDLQSSLPTVEAIEQALDRE